MEGFYFSFDSKEGSAGCICLVDGAALSCLEVRHFKSFWVVGFVQEKLA